MKKIFALLALLPAVLLMFGIGNLLAAEKDDVPQKVTAPKAVMEAFQKAYPKGEVKSVGMETKDGKDYYEIESIDGKTERDILYNADGAVFEIEESILPETLPDVIKMSLKKEYPKGEIREAEKISRGKVVEYETLLENGEENIEVVLDDSGKILTRQVVSDDDQVDDEDAGSEVEDD
ncbi:MAG: hypothetical protein CVT49_13020 [candidate division Zixibacteria bacterium HGW-Zixibacteria-1]|nr:MAG: hypothetical protein CVT49_13020 [candidate division Zixibacteria bacterium HGW-Zixibacteria-1]